MEDQNETDASGFATYKQAMEFLSLSRQSVYRMTIDGRLMPVRFGRSVRFRWSDLRGLGKDDTDSE